MSEKREGPILAMAIGTLVLIIVMAAVSGMTLYTALFPPNFEERAREVEKERADSSKSEGPASPSGDESMSDVSPVTPGNDSSASTTDNERPKSEPPDSGNATDADDTRQDN